MRFRHRVDELTTTGGVVDGVRGVVLAPSDAARGDDQLARGGRRLRDQRAGGRRHQWWHRRGPRPRAQELAGPPRETAAAHGQRCARATSTAECSPSPRTPAVASSTRTACGTTPRACTTGTRSGRDTASASCPGPSSLWLDATGKRLPPPLFPGFDTLGTLEHIMRTGYDYTWFVLTQRIIEREFALSGSEQNPDLTGKSVRDVLGRLKPGAPAPVEAFKTKGCRLRRRGHVAGAGRRHEPAGRQRPRRPRRARARDRRARPRGRQPVHQGPADHRTAGRAQATLATG